MSLSAASSAGGFPAGAGVGIGTSSRYWAGPPWSPRAAQGSNTSPRRVAAQLPRGDFAPPQHSGDPVPRAAQGSTTSPRRVPVAVQLPRGGFVPPHSGDPMPRAASPRADWAAHGEVLARCVSILLTLTFSFFALFGLDHSALPPHQPPAALRLYARPSQQPVPDTDPTRVGGGELATNSDAGQRTAERNGDQQPDGAGPIRKGMLGLQPDGPAAIERPDETGRAAQPALPQHLPEDEASHVQASCSRRPGQGIRANPHPPPAVDPGQIKIRNHKFRARDGASVRVRMYLPRLAGPDSAAGAVLPTVIYFPSSGARVRALKDAHEFVAQLAAALRCAVVSVAYRLGQQHPFPTALHDAVDAILWVANFTAERGLGSILAVAGHSAGANLAAAAALELPALGLRAQVLLAPITNFAFDTPSYASFAKGYSLSRGQMKTFWGVYTNSSAATAAHPRVSILRAGLDDLAQTPRALVLVSGCDVLRDEGFAYAQRLRKAGVSVSVFVATNSTHGAPMHRRTEFGAWVVVIAFLRDVFSLS